MPRTIQATVDIDNDPPKIILTLDISTFSDKSYPYAQQFIAIWYVSACGF